MFLQYIRFFDTNVTTRTASSIARLLRCCSQPLIQEGYGIGEKALSTVIQDLKKSAHNNYVTDYRHPESNPLALALCYNLKGEKVVYCSNTQTNALIGAYTLSEFKQLVLQDDSLCSNMIAIGFSDSEVMHELYKNHFFQKFAVSDVIDYLSTAFIYYPPCLDGRDQSQSLDASEIISVISYELAELDAWCKDTEHNLENSDSDRADQDMNNNLRKRLTKILLMAETSLTSGKPVFPELATAVSCILQGCIEIDLIPAHYFTGSIHPVFWEKIADSFNKIHQFARIAENNCPDDANLNFALDRLIYFNEPATAILSFDNRQQRIAKTVFQMQHPKDFCQLNIPLKAVRLECLSHLIEYGLLDTEAPMLDLPCIGERLQYGAQGRCKISECPFLKDEQ